MDKQVDKYLETVNIINGSRQSKFLRSMKFFLSLQLIIIFLNIDVSAQNAYEILQAVDFFNYTKLERGEWKLSYNETEIEGSPYLNNNFIEGSVYTTSKTSYVGIPLRYNIYNDRLEFRFGKGPVQVMTVPEILEKAEFGENTLEYSVYKVNNRIKRGYFVVIEKGDATLYSRPRVKFEGAKSAEPFKAPEPPKFIRQSDEYYIKVGMKPAVIISKKRDLEGLFPEHKAEIRNFIKKNEINTNRSESLTDLVKFYNSL
jgi:hypothetical protein